MTNKLFVQVGATRDGLDPYLKSARDKELKTILIETAHYLDLRKHLLRQDFDLEIAIENPADVNELIQALTAYQNDMTLMLAGFDRYVEATYAVAEKFKVLPWRNSASTHFVPLDKDQQRLLLKQEKNIKQPRFQIIDLANIPQDIAQQITYPLVVKPTNGAGGLGIYLVNNENELSTTLNLLKKMTNYDGSLFSKILLEEFIIGVEMSVQGVCYQQQIQILGACEKIIRTSFLNQENAIQDFREVGHIAYQGKDLPAHLLEFVANALKLFNYQEGPFHIDFIVNEKGIYFLEAGFRLSGGAIVALVHKISGAHWADISFDIFFDEYNQSLAISDKTQHSYIGLSNLHRAESLEKAKKMSAEISQIEVQSFTINGQMIAARNKNLNSSLSADILRHGSTLGRIWIYGSEEKTIKNIIKNVQGIQ